MLGPPVPSDFRYFVVVAERARQRPDVMAFVRWVEAEAERTRALLAEVLARPD